MKSTKSEYIIHKQARNYKFQISNVLNLESIYSNLSRVSVLEFSIYKRGEI